MSDRWRRLGLFAACLLVAAGIMALLDRPSQEEQWEEILTGLENGLSRMKAAHGYGENTRAFCEARGVEAPCNRVIFEHGIIVMGE